MLSRTRITALKDCNARLAQALTSISTTTTAMMATIVVEAEAKACQEYNNVLVAELKEFFTLAMMTTMPAEEYITYKNLAFEQLDLSVQLMRAARIKWNE
jgi:hypothetical protein